MTKTPDRPLISIIVPVFNEEENVETFYSKVNAVLQEVREKYQFEFVFTDNHSTDRTFEILSKLCTKDERIRVYRFSRNFGYQRSIYTGYVKARGQAAIQLDCDLQDPPELIPEFLAKWEEGYEVVYGVRSSRKEGWWINSLRRIFYRTIDFLSEDKLPLEAGDFRLIDRRVLNELRKIKDAQPYLRGTIATMGFSQFGLPYDRAERFRGESKFSFIDLVRLALDGILNHSLVPLRIASIVGIIASLVTILGIFVYFLGRIFWGADWPAGFATTTILILFSISLNALFLGVIGEYLGRIYFQVKIRPMTIIEEEISNN